MSSFTERELAYQLLERHLARHLTVGADGMPQVAPVGFSYNADLDGIEVPGRTSSGRRSSATSPTRPRPSR